MSSTAPQPGSSAQPGCAPSPADGIEYDRFLDCVHCGLCTSACPTYLETGNENDGPRGRIYLMRAVADGKAELTDTVRRHLDLCLDCRSCETACPSGVQYGRLIEPFRVGMQRMDAHAHGEAAPGWFQRVFLYGLFPYPRRMRWALLPARVAQVLRIDRALEAVGATKLLPERLQRMQRLLPRLQPRGGRLPDVLPAIGPRRARVGLFTGCVADAIFGATNRATARVLQANGCEVVVPRSQVCCGAIHYHSGAGEPALEFAAANAAAFNTDDLDAIIVNVAGCGSMLKDYGHIAHELAPGDEERPEMARSPDRATGATESLPERSGDLRSGAAGGSGDPRRTVQERLERFALKVRDVSEFLMELGPIAPKGEIRLRATYHDACHLVHAQKIREQPRSLLAMVPGLELLPLAESEICCGAAGSYNLTEPEMADRLAQRKLQNILETGAQAVITGNAGCSMQLQAALREAGREDIRVLHPIDVLDASYRGISG